jgi:hypothetical protein
MVARSLNAYLTRLIWLCVGPLILLAGWLSVDHVRTLRDQDDLQATNLARNFATAIDQHLSARIGALNMLAISPQVDDATRWQDLYREAQGFHQSFGSHVILADLEMRMLFNTRVPFGTVLPALPRPKGNAAAPTALASGKPAVGDTFIGPIATEPLVAIAVPALRDGKVAYLVLSIFETSLFQRRLDQHALPVGWSMDPARWQERHNRPTGAVGYRRRCRGTLYRQVGDSAVVGGAGDSTRRPSGTAGYRRHDAGTGTSACHAGQRHWRHAGRSQTGAVGGSPGATADQRNATAGNRRKSPPCADCSMQRQNNVRAPKRRSAHRSRKRA